MLCLKEKFLLRDPKDAKQFVKSLTQLEGVVKGWAKDRYAFLIMELPANFPYAAGTIIHYSYPQKVNEMVESKVVYVENRVPKRKAQG